MNRHLILALVLTLALCIPLCAQVADSLAYGKVAPEHGFLERLSGRWNTSVRLWPSAADTHAVAASGRSVTHMALGGRYLVEEDTMSVPDKSYLTLAILGFDNLKHKYVETWMDNRSTGLLELTGAVNDSGDVLTMQGERMDPKGGKSKMSFIYHSLNGNFRTLEIWETRGTGKPRRTLELVYTRAK